MKCMSHAHRENVVGAFGLLLADRLDDVAEHAGGRSVAAALVTLSGTRAGLSIDGLARVSGLSHSGAVRLVDRLAADGLVERRRGVDQRSTALFLTPGGRRAARRTLRARGAALQSLLALLTDDQQADLARIVGDLLARLGSEPVAEARICRLCDVVACGRSQGRCPVAPAPRRRAIMKT